MADKAVISNQKLADAVYLCTAGEMGKSVFIRSVRKNPKIYHGKNVAMRVACDVCCFWLLSEASRCMRITTNPRRETRITLKSIA